jgi:hypothetical protein
MNHNARIREPEPTDTEIEARIRLAQIMTCAANVKRWAQAHPEFASESRAHPVARLIRTYDELCCNTALTSAVESGKIAIEQAAADRILQTATPDEKRRAALAVVMARKGMIP